MEPAPDAECIRQIVDAATRAPSVHNSQPWLWDWDHERLHLMADWSRQLRYADPAGRDLVISCGAALHHACLAAAAQGWRATVTRVPQSPDDRVLASLVFTPAEPSLLKSVALDAVLARQTDRRTPSCAAIPPGRVEALVRTAGIHGALATMLPDEASDDLRDLMMVSSMIQHASDAYLDELAAWTHAGGDDGVADANVLFRPGRDVAGDVDSRFACGRLLDTPGAPGRPHQSWILLGTSSDDTVSRLRAGEALSAILVLAHLQGLAVVPYTQPIEVDTTRNGLEQALLRGSCNLQVILRVAVPAEGSPLVRPTRRRPVHAVLRVNGSPAPATHG
jgi:hypothetical protein